MSSLSIIHARTHSVHDTLVNSIANLFVWNKFSFTSSDTRRVSLRPFQGCCREGYTAHFYFFQEYWFTVYWGDLFPPLSDHIREDTHKKVFFSGRTTKVLPSLHQWLSGTCHFFLVL